MWVAWVQILFLYAWLGAAMYLFYLWSKMCRSIFRSMETLTNAGGHMVEAVDDFSSRLSACLDNATEMITRLERQFYADEVNPLLDEYEKYKVD